MRKTELFKVTCFGNMRTVSYDNFQEAMKQVRRLQAYGFEGCLEVDRDNFNKVDHIANLSVWMFSNYFGLYHSHSHALILKNSKRNEPECTYSVLRMKYPKKER